MNARLYLLDVCQGYFEAEGIADQSGRLNLAGAFLARCTPAQLGAIGLSLPKLVEAAYPAKWQRVSSDGEYRDMLVSLWTSFFDAKAFHEELSKLARASS